MILIDKKLRHFLFNKLQVEVYWDREVGGKLSVACLSLNM